MNKNIKISFSKFKVLSTSKFVDRFLLIFSLISAGLLLPFNESKSEAIFLKCIGKFELNRGALIKPDWETSFFTINLDGSQSTIYDKVTRKKGNTLIRRNSYTIIHRDDNNTINNIYKINRTYGNYIVESPKNNRVLIGTCQKGRG
tara:strand:+ start:175 stop:612 length:438 start_codon:yes stop_codon:yes gene_type:complete